MAAELVSSVLDVQLRQLRENNLDKLPIYADIQSMRGNIDELVDKEMKAVVELLESAQKAPEAQRQQILVDARGKIREIVVSLMAQRQKLYKRMQLAKIAAQVRQLIVMETKVTERTKALPEEEPKTREQSTLTTLEDQRDVAALYNALLGVLDDVSQWEGQIGAGASKGLRLLKTLRVEADLQLADASLAASKFDEAARAELAVAKALKALLEIIEEIQGLEGSDRESVARMVADLLKEQEKIREQTKSADLAESKQAEEMAQQQHELHQELGQLAESLEPFAGTEPLAEQAKAAAYEAESKIFEGEQAKAVAEQGKVIGALAEIAKKLEQAAETTSDKTAEQLAQQVQQLEKLDQALTETRARQNEAGQNAAANAPAAKAKEDQVAQQLAQANQAADFGAAIETRLADAQDAVAAAQQTLQNPAPEMAPQRIDSAQAAMQAIDQAATEVKQALADRRREQLAVKVGELARAAEALERAAAAEHEIGESAAEASHTDGLSREESQPLSIEQGRINAVARDITEGVKSTSPQAAKQLTDAKPVLDAAAQQIQAAMKNPGEPSKPTANQLADSARQGEQRLEQAAATLRKEAGEAASQLADLAAQQLKPVVDVRQAVDKAHADSQAADSPAEALAKLQHALDQTRQAQVEQMRAAGKPAAAQAQELADDIGRVIEQQMAADRAAQDLALGRTSSPLNASAAEQQVADAAEALVNGENPAGSSEPAAPKREAPQGQIAQELQRAAQNAADAAKEQVVGNPNKAAAARQEARNALRRAQTAANQAATEAAKLPAGQLDAKAQKHVTKLAEEANQDAESAAPQAASSLADAQAQSAGAEKSLAGGELQPATEAQAKSSEALARSKAQLQDAISQLAKRQAELAARQGTQAGELADQALPVDAGAAVALQQAESAAMRAAANPAEGDSAGDAEKAVERGLERAAASLEAREDELRRDASIAAAIAQLAKDQQAARDQIAANAAKLEQLAKSRPADPKRPADPNSPTESPSALSPEELSAAQSLAEAVQQFGDAQRATGEGAAEISGQDQVANKPIRQGLETASQLGMTPDPPVTPPQQVAGTPATAKSESPEAATQNNPPAPKPSGSEPAAPTAAPSSENAPDATAGSNELGTGFVPNSPEFTAQQIAGDQAWKEVQQAMANQHLATAAEPTDKPPTEDAGSLQPTEQPASSKVTATARKGGNAVESKQQGENQTLPDQAVEQTASDEKRDSRSAEPNDNKEVGARKFDDEPWFAKLPPSLQKAIHTKSRREAPRGYEERLKRYFESK